MKIERIVKKGRDKAVIYFDNDSSLVVQADIVYKSGLRKEDEISEDRFEILKTENLSYQILQKALRLLARKIHSEKELYLKLRQSFQEVSLIKKTISYLKEKKYLDDHTYAKAFKKEKQRLKNWGKNKIVVHLVKKGISKEIINDIFKDEETDEKEFDIALASARKKNNKLQLRVNDEKELNKKLALFLNSKGFSYSTIKDVLLKLKSSKN